jgi:hypothetical protein
LFWRVFGADCTNILSGENVGMVEMGFGGMDWIDLAQDGDRWRALVNAVVNLHVP